MAAKDQKPNVSMFTICITETQLYTVSQVLLASFILDGLVIIFLHFGSGLRCNTEMYSDITQNIIHLSVLILSDMLCDV